MIFLQRCTAKSILDMVHAYEAFSGKTFDETVLKQLLERREAGAEPSNRTEKVRLPCISV